MQCVAVITHVVFLNNYHESHSVMDVKNKFNRYSSYLCPFTHNKSITYTV